ncbi:HD domain-containing protein [Kocuria rhizophila]|nr:HD domain-containing protein [Kocuria rhizophila]
MTKLDDYGEMLRPRPWKMIVAMAKDTRVLAIKLADRLHNARGTWRFVSPRPRAQGAETWRSSRRRPWLGMNTIKWELEDLLRGAVPQGVRRDRAHGGGANAERSATSRSPGPRSRRPEGSGIEATITGRPKHYYSTTRR